MTLSATVLAQLAAVTAMPRTLYRFNLDGGLVRLTNHHADLTFQGAVYSAFPINHGPINTYLSEQIGACDITLGNADKSISAYAAYQDFEGRSCEIWEVYLNANYTIIDGNPGSDDKRIKFRGTMEPIEPGKETATVRVVSVFDRSESYGPWRIFGPRCNNDFCDANCGRRGGTGMLYGTATAGTATYLRDSTVPNDAYNVADYWVGATITFLSGTNRGLSRRIIDYATATRQFSWTTPTPAACDVTTTYVIECDKSKASCTAQSNQANFDGFAEQIEIQDKIYASWSDPISDLKIFGPNRLADPLSSTNIIPIIYGVTKVPGVCIDEFVDIDVYRFYSHIGDRLYAVCEGEIDSIQAMIVNGVVIPSDQYTVYRGTTTQSFDFHGETKYYHRTVVVQTNQPYVGIWKQDGSPDDVQFIVNGLKVQRYYSDGSILGSPFFSQNAVWCMLDYELKRSHQKLLAADIDFASASAAAALCESGNWIVNLKLDAQQKEPDIINFMLAACRGYFTYENGLQQVTIEQAWSGPVAFAFDDTSAGHTENNIMPGSFSYPKRTVKDTPNCITVKYIDSEIRENVALLTSPATWGDETVSFDSVGGTLISGGFYIGPFRIGGTLSGNSFTGCSWGNYDADQPQYFEAGYPLFQGPQLFPERTALYKDKKNIDAVKRVINKDIDGTAIGSYRQAYQIAEWTGRKAVDGNRLCRLRGRRDSMKVLVGQVVSVTHAWPGWVDVPFRIIEKSESEGTQADFVMEYYDDAFYGANGPLPPTRISSTLPNPFAPLGLATSLAVEEQVGALLNGQYQPILMLTYTMPTDGSGLFWSHANIYLRIGASGPWILYGSDYSKGAGFYIDHGFVLNQSLTILVQSVKTGGIISDFNSSPSVSMTPTNIVLTSISTITAQVVDNNVLIYWTGVDGKYPIKTYEIRKGDTYAGATVIGLKSGTFTSVFETAPGTYKYWVTPIDVNGVAGSPASISAFVNQPPDFQLHDSFDDFFTGTKTDVVYDAAEQKFYAPVDATQTFSTYSGTLGGTTMANFVSAGTYLIEPGKTTGRYVYTVDLGVVVPATTVTATLSQSLLIGAVTVTPTISVGIAGTSLIADGTYDADGTIEAEGISTESGITWIDFPNVWSAFSTNVRNIKVTLDFAGAGGSNVMVLSNLHIGVSVKKVYDGGRSTVSDPVNGKIVKFTRDFIDIISIGPTPEAAESRTATYAFVDSYSTTGAACTTTLLHLAAGEGSEWTVGDFARVPLASGIYTPMVTGISGDDLTVEELPTAPPTNVAIYHASFTVWLWDKDGIGMTGNFSWDVTGI